VERRRPRGARAENRLGRETPAEMPVIPDPRVAVGLLPGPRPRLAPLLEVHAPTARQPRRPTDLARQSVLVQPTARSPTARRHLQAARGPGDPTHLVGLPRVGRRPGPRAPTGSHAHRPRVTVSPLLALRMNVAGPLGLRSDRPATIGVRALPQTARQNRRHPVPRRPCRGPCAPVRRPRTTGPRMDLPDRRLPAVASSAPPTKSGPRHGVDQARTRGLGRRGHPEPATAQHVPTGHVRAVPTGHVPAVPTGYVRVPVRLGSSAAFGVRPRSIP
jgi:hypothetical protein